MDFNALHQQNQPLLLANVWDASSAQAAQQAGYQALGSSSAAIAAMLGYEDGEEMSFDELFYVVSRIKTVSELPLSVDLEAGYGATTSLIIDNIRRLAHLGVSGINLEDSHVVDSTRRLDDAERFAVKLQEITRACPGLFVNVRTDTFFSTYKMRWFKRSIAVNSTPNTAHAVFCALRHPRGGYYRHRSPRAFTLKRNVYA